MDVDQGWCIGWREVSVILGSWMSFISVLCFSTPSLSFLGTGEGREKIPCKMEMAP